VALPARFSDLEAQVFAAGIAGLILDTGPRQPEALAL
jgi:hypothetical protein